MASSLRGYALRALAAGHESLCRRWLFNMPAQDGHEALLRWLRRMDRLPPMLAAALRHALTEPAPVTVGGAELPQRFMLAAGLVKGDGFEDEARAMAALASGRNIMPGWRTLPALMGPIEFGSFTRQPRMGNSGTVMWRDAQSRSTQNRVGLRNPGARAAAAFLGQRRQLMPACYGINIAPTPGLQNIRLQARAIQESLQFFFSASLRPSWFTLNLSCPNTEDDPRGLQLEQEARALCQASVDAIAGQGIGTPLWVKISPGLASEQLQILLRVFADVGVRAVIACNTLAKASPLDDTVVAGAGGAALHEAALQTVRLLHAHAASAPSVDIIACGGIMDGESWQAYRRYQVTAGQYWSAVVYRGPFAASIIEREWQTHESARAASRRQSLA